MSTGDPPAPEGGAANVTRKDEPRKPGLVFTKVTRQTVWRDTTGEGYHLAVQCAVRRDRTSPAVRYLQGLRGGVRREDPQHRPPRDLEQIHDYELLLAKIEHIGFTGQPARRSDVNDLDDGIWEFRHGVRRLSYWDTKGDGTFNPKLRLTDIRELPPETSPDGPWWYPDMDLILRLGCGWDKDAQAAPPEKVQEALAIREEDVEHDRT